MVPRHVALILDGNRRFAKAIGKQPWIGHKYGVLKTREVIGWACDHGIKQLTGYVLSLENLKSRPKKELEMIFKYFENELDAFLDKDHVINQKKARVKFAGRTDLLPKKIQNKMKIVENATKNNRKHVFNICVAYGGQQEIVNACREIAQEAYRRKLDPSKINLKLFSHHLWVNGGAYPDLVIRTGGDRRLSNFLPFQSAYSEIFFLDKRWPEVTKRDFENILKEYESRERRFGK